MDDLWSERKKAHYKFLLKYLRYVFNDHFMLVLLVLLGGVIYSYGQWLNGLSKMTNAGWFSVIAWVGLYFWLSVGQLVLLITAADQVFLLTQHDTIIAYLKRATGYSMRFCSLLQAVGVLSFCPLLIVAVHFTPLQLICLFVLQCGMKCLLLELQHLRLVVVSSSKHEYIFARIVLPVVIYTLLSLQLAGLVAAVVFFAVAFWRLCFKLKKSTLFIDWKTAITKEQQHRSRQLAFLALFCNVKQPQAAPKRRKYLDKLLHSLVENHSVGEQLFWTIALRSRVYYNLFWRLLVVANILVAIAGSWWLAALIGALFIYLLAIQLVPLYDVLFANVFVKVYPQDKASWQQAFKSVFLRIILAQWGLLSVVSAVVLSVCGKSIYDGLVCAAIWLAIAVGLGLLYAPAAVKKRQQ